MAPGVGKSLDAARESACATKAGLHNCQQLWSTCLWSLLQPAASIVKPARGGLKPAAG